MIIIINVNRKSEVEKLAFQPYQSYKITINVTQWKKTIQKFTKEYEDDDLKPIV